MRHERTAKVTCWFDLINAEFRLSLNSSALLFHVSILCTSPCSPSDMFTLCLYQYIVWGLHCSWQYHWGERTETDDVIGASLAGEPSMTWFLKYQPALIFSQVFPIFRNPLGIIFYCWQVIIILCCCICPRLTTIYHTRSSRPFRTAILRQVRIDNVACGVPKRMVRAYIFPHPYPRCNFPHSTFLDGLGQVRVDNVACGVPKQMVRAYIFPHPYPRCDCPHSTFLAG